MDTIDTKTVIPDDLLWFSELTNKLIHRGVTFGQIVETFVRGNEWNRRMEQVINTTLETMKPNEVADLKSKLEMLQPKDADMIMCRYNEHEHIFTGELRAAQYIHLTMSYHTKRNPALSIEDICRLLQDKQLYEYHDGSIKCMDCVIKVHRIRST